MVITKLEMEWLAWREQAGFTMIELLVAMAIFSFMLLIVVSGFIGVVHLRSQAVESNKAQDNARTAINEVVRAVRDSDGIKSIAPGSVCLNKVGGQVQQYFVGSGILTRSDDCALAGAPHINAQAITNSSVNVADFTVVQENIGPTIVKPEVSISITVASNNSTTTGSGSSTVCNPSGGGLPYCSSVTLKSGAVPR